MVEDEALERVEEECVADAAERKSRRANAARRRAELDEIYVLRFAERIREIYGYCPTGRKLVTAEHSCPKYSGRVGRSTTAKALDDAAVRLAAAAHVRHAETEFDDLLQRGCEPHEARQQAQEQVAKLLTRWEHD